MNLRETSTHRTSAYQSREEPERLYALAGRYWRVMLFVEIALFCAAVVGGGYMLVMTFFNLSPSSAPAIPSPVLNRSQLKQTIAGFESRKTLFQQYETAAEPVSDPSK